MISGIVKRHQALVPLSHDHHHALVAAQRLRRAAEGDGDPGAAVAAFVSFFATNTLPHFREEEERWFPLVAEVDEARSPLLAALLDHQRLRSLVTQMEQARDVHLMRDVAELLEAHVRREERELFPLLERLAAAQLDAAEGVPVTGPIWAQASEDLDATLVEWAAACGPGEHVEDAGDVLIFVVDGSATLASEDDEHELFACDHAIVAKGRRWNVVGGPHGVRYLSVRARR
jgi:hypothetical protein